MNASAVGETLFQRLRRNPFVHVREPRVRERAYFLWRNAGAPARGDAMSDWLRAEADETEVEARLRLVHVWDPAHPASKDRVFDEAYRVVAQERFDTATPPPVRSVGARTPRTCALCERSAPAAKFSDISHLLPELMGASHLRSLEECMPCNQKYGKTWEDALGKMLQPERALSHIEGKGGPIKHKLSHKSVSFFGREKRGDLFQVEIRDDEVQTRMREQELVIEARAPRYMPEAALRSMVKSAWLLLDTDSRLGAGVRARHPMILRWLRDEHPLPHAVFYRGSIPGFEPRHAGMTVWERVAPDPTLPALVVLLHMANVFLLWGEPDWATGEPLPMVFPLLPHGAFGKPPQLTQVLAKPGAHHNPGRVSFNMGFLRRELRVHEPVSAEVRAGSEPALSTEFAASELREQNDGATLLYRLSGGQLPGTLELRAPSSDGPWSIDWQRTEDADPAQLRRALAVIRAIARGEPVSISDASTGDSLVAWPSAESVPNDSGEADFLYWFATQLETLNMRLGVDLRCSPRLTADDANIIAFAVALTEGEATNERAEDEVVDLAGDHASFSPWLDALDTTPQQVTHEIENLTLPLLGHQVSFGRCRITLVNARPAEPIAAVRGRLASASPGEQTTVATIFDEIRYTLERTQASDSG